MTEKPFIRISRGLDVNLSRLRAVEYVYGADGLPETAYLVSIGRDDIDGTTIGGHDALCLHKYIHINKPYIPVRIPHDGGCIDYFAANAETIRYTREGDASEVRACQITWAGGSSLAIDDPDIAARVAVTMLGNMFMSLNPTMETVAGPPARLGISSFDDYQSRGGTMPIGQWTLYVHRYNKLADGLRRDPSEGHRAAIIAEINQISRILRMPVSGTIDDPPVQTEGPMSFGVGDYASYTRRGGTLPERQWTQYAREYQTLMRSIVFHGLPAPATSMLPADTLPRITQLVDLLKIDPPTGLPIPTPPEAPSQTL